MSPATLDPDVLARVTALLRRHAISPDMITGPDCSLLDDLALDSLALAELEVELLGAFRVPLADWYQAEAEAGGRFTLGSLVRFLAAPLRDG